MRRRAFQICGWAALTAALAAAVAALTAGAVGVLALAGQVTYPAEVGIGPLSVRSAVTMPVALITDACQTADITTPDPAGDCLAFFLHPQDTTPGGVRRQDADVRPTVVTLTGQAELATTGGWSALVAASVARTVITLGMLTAGLLLLWRLLATAARTDVFHTRAVGYVRGIGWLVIAATLVDPALRHFANAGQLGYTIEAFGTGPHLAPLSSGGYPGGIDLTLMGLGVLVLLVAEVFRHGIMLRDEQRLTI